ncbi:MAG: hypothetical protein MJB14_03515, partial [Spirochaetes bacterium]|nr:hypothetical protein [Spirochaetota bacterium]
KDCFYQIVINYHKDRLTERSQKNLSEYLKFQINRFDLLMNINITKLEITNTDNINIYDQYLQAKDQGELITAEKYLSQVEKENQNNYQNLENMEKVDPNYQNTLKKSIYETTEKKYLEEVAHLEDLQNKVDEERNELALINDRIKYNLSLADELYKDAVNFDRRYDLEKAKDIYEKSRDKYVEVRRDTKSSYVDNQLATIEKRLNFIEEKIAQTDLKNAEESLAKARAYLYADDYLKARNEINLAKIIYKKYDIENPLLDNLDERITKSLKIASGKKLIIGDPLYEKIIELINIANSLYSKQQYEEALAIVDQILSEKPYHEEAKRLETKILKIFDPESYQLRFNTYWSDAVTFYQQGNYERAYQEFEQLKEFQERLTEINKYIYNCKVNLGLIQKVLTAADKQAALNLVKSAQTNYNRGQLQQALTLVEQAINIWDKVPGARDIQYKVSIGLKKPLPKLTSNEQIILEKANEYYRKREYEKAYEKTNEILNRVDKNALQYKEVVDLNRKAYLKMKSVSS